MVKYIYQLKNWTQFTWDDKVINPIFGEVRHRQGKLFGLINTLGFTEKEEATLSALTTDVVKSSEIEGEILNIEQVRSSIARRLGIQTAGLVSSNRHIEGVVEMMLDATQNFHKPLTAERMFGWHAALFPTGYSGPYKIEVGQYRTGEIQVVSGAMGKEKVHYEAIGASLVHSEMDKFLDWFNNEVNIDGVLKAAIAHFWFIIIHPFDDGNGRIARALSDLMLARAEENSNRFYSMSGQILIERKQYYHVLQKVQHSTGDITEWLLWFLRCLNNALLETENNMQKILRKSEFWNLHQSTVLNGRQRQILNKLLDGFDGKLQTGKYANITKTSTDSALRDLKDLVEKGILKITDAGGRSTSYDLADF